MASQTPLAPIRSEERIRTGYLYLVTFVAAVGGFLFGYDLSLISGAVIFLKAAWNLSPFGLGVVTGSAILGCPFGPLAGVWLADRFGRNKTLLLSAVLFIVSAIGSALAHGIIDFSFWRFVGGIGVGLASTVSPMYIAELAPARLDGFAVQSFSSIPNELGSFLQFGQCLVADAGYPVGPESDLHATVSSLLLEAAAASAEPSFIPDITIRHPQNDNAVLLWHADAPLALRHPDSAVKVDLPWILQGLPTGLVHFRLKDGPLTLCRFEGHGDGYRLGCGEGHTVPGPYTQEFFTWMEVDHWPTWERQLIYGPYIHHCSCAYDHCADVIEEALRYVPHLQFERFGKTSAPMGDKP